MKMKRKALVASVIGMVAVSTFYGGAANAATGAAEKDVDHAGVENVALAVYEELSSAADPMQVYAGLATEEREAFEAYFLPAEADEAVTLTRVDASGKPVEAATTYLSEADAMDIVAASTSCWIGTSKYTMKAALGNAIWDTWTEGTWCGNGSSVTSAAFSRSWSTIAAVGWRDAGQIGSGSGIAGGQARMWSQRKMILGAGGWDVQTQQPCNRLNGGPSGGVSQTWSCSIV